MTDFIISLATWVMSVTVHQAYCIVPVLSFNNKSRYATIPVWTWVDLKPGCQSIVVSVILQLSRSNTEFKMAIWNRRLSEQETFFRRFNVSNISNVATYQQTTLRNNLGDQPYWLSKPRKRDLVEDPKWYQRIQPNGLSILIICMLQHNQRCGGHSQAQW